jgi:hypothetical protein
LPAGVDTASSGYPGSSSSSSTNAGSQPRGEFVFAPIPFSNKAFAFGIIPVIDYVFRVDPKDRESPPSSLVGVGMLASGDSWALGGGASLYLKRDRFRPKGFGGHGSVGYDLFGTGTQNGDRDASIPIRQGGTLAMAEFLVRVHGKFYIGPRFNYRNLSAELRSTADALPEGISPDDLGSQFKTHAFGLKVLHDTRDDIFYPTSGHTFEAVGDFFEATRTAAALEDKELQYQNYKVSYDHYHSLSQSQVLAFRTMACAVNGDPPFYELCLFGMHSDLRGYQPGRYRDRKMFAAQTEYRKTLGPRWGFVVFGGVGEVAETWKSFNSEDLLPAGGTGIRFNLSKKDRIHFRADIAIGKNGWAWHVAAAEAF